MQRTFFVRKSSAVLVSELSLGALEKVSVRFSKMLILNPFRVVCGCNYFIRSGVGAVKTFSSHSFSNNFSSSPFKFARVFNRNQSQNKLQIRLLTSGPGQGDRNSLRKRSTLYYLAAVGVLVVGASYAAVPLYRIFCQSYSYGGTTGTHDNTRDLTGMKKAEKQITIRFNADRSSNLMWNFRPEQTEIIVSPGETALAFYRAENRTPHPIDGISTYNVIPFEAGQYFNKIQCFCFEEQRLNPGETVELPVFFYIDPEFVEDPRMEHVDMITLSYTFFESKDMPGWDKVIGGAIGHGGKFNKVGG